MTETPPIDNSATMTAPPSLEYFRVTGIHSETTTEELISAVSAKFSDDEGDIQIEVSIVPQCDSTDDTKTGLVYFTKVPKFLDVLYNGDEETLVDTTIGELYFDKTFYGLTQLYPTTTQRKITAEMMIYGYNSKLMGSGITIRDYSLGLLEDIKKARGTIEEKERSIIFIGHSVGSLIIAQCMMQAKYMHSSDPAAYTIFCATKVLMFFGTLHLELLTDDILSMVHTEYYEERRELVKSVDKDSRDLQSQLRRFNDIAPHFRIFSFYELRQLKQLIEGPNGTWNRNGDLIIPTSTESPLFNLSNTLQTRIPVDQCHSNMVKFNSSQNRTYRSVVTYLLDITDEWVLSHAGYSTKLSNSATKALVSAVIKNDVRLIRLLLQKGANPNCSNDIGSMLHIAVVAAKVAVVRLLFDWKTDIQAKRDNGEMLLHSAAQSGHEPVVRLLLDHKADVQAMRDDGWKALHFAACHGHYTTVQLLLDRKADIHAKNTVGSTALHLAAENGHEATVRLLLDHKADINAKLGDSRTALQLAIEKGHEATIQLLSDSQPHLSSPSPVNVIPCEKPTLEASNIYSPLLINTERRNPDNQEPLE